MPAGSADSVAEYLLALVTSRPPTLGSGRLVCLDGPGGSGKTTLAAALVHAHGAGARAVHMDALYDGWAGLGAIHGQLADLLGPLARGRAGRYRRYDWHARRFAETVVVEPGALLVLEGVGSGSSPATAVCTLLAWVEAPPELRLERGIERDGEALREQWRRWREQEEAHFDVGRTRERAEVLVDGTGAEGPILLADRPADLGR